MFGDLGWRLFQCRAAFQSVQFWCRITQMSENLLVRQAMHIQKELLLNNCSSCWLYKLKNTLRTIKFGLDIWNKWMLIDNFRIDCFSSVPPISTGVSTGESDELIKKKWEDDFFEEYASYLDTTWWKNASEVKINKNSYIVSDSFRSNCTIDSIIVM